MLFSHVDTSWLRRIRESVRFGSLTDMAISPRRAARASSAVANDGHPLFEHFVGARPIAYLNGPVFHQISKARAPINKAITLTDGSKLLLWVKMHQSIHPAMVMMNVPAYCQTLSMPSAPTLRPLRVDIRCRCRLCDRKVLAPCSIRACAFEILFIELVHNPHE